MISIDMYRIIAQSYFEIDLANTTIIDNEGIDDINGYAFTALYSFL